MTVNKLPLLLPMLLLALGTTLRADEIELKSGETLSGRITYESEDIVKIRISVSDSIKQTKVLGRDEIASISKTPPDQVKFNEVQKLLPAEPLTSSSAYRSAIQSGPAAFLEKFPDSRHVPEVERIEKKLEKELDKVERGSIKLGREEWVSPQEQQQFESRIQSRILWIRMRRAAEPGNYNAYIAAMRLFEKIEDRYVGTPAFAKALDRALQIVPALGQQVQRLYRDVQARKAEYEKNKAVLDEVARKKVEAARAREEANYQESLAADKEAGIKWVRINPLSKTSLEDYLQLAQNELSRLGEYDLGALTAQAEKLSEIDDLIAKGNLERARIKLDDAAGMAGESKADDDTGSYVATLRSKIEQRSQDRAAKAKARKEAAESESLAANLKKTEKGDDADEAEEDADAESEGEGDEGDQEEEKADSDESGDEPQSGKTDESEDSSSSADTFAALADVDPEADSGSSGGDSESDDESSGTDSADEDEEEEEADDDPPPASGGGISPTIIVMGLTGLLLIAIVVLKVLGIGDKKEE